MTATYLVPAVAGAERITLARAVSDTLVITRRNLLRNVRLPPLLVYSTVQPVMFLLLFNYVFGGATGQVVPGSFDSPTVQRHETQGRAQVEQLVAWPSMRPRHMRCRRRR